MQTDKRYTSTTGTTYTAGDDHLDVFCLAASFEVDRYLADLNDRMFSSGLADTWTTDLWDRDARSWANAEINRAQARLRRARGARTKSRCELEIIRLSNIVKSTARKE